MTIFYDDVNLPDGVNLATLDLYRFNEGTNKWEKMNATHDLANKKVELCGVNQFSQWTLAGSAPESVPLKNWGLLAVILVLIGGVVLKIFR